MPVKIFISSVQNELQGERRELARFIRQDALLQKINAGYFISRKNSGLYSGEGQVMKSRWIYLSSR